MTMISLTNIGLWNDMLFMRHLFDEVCEFIDKMILCSGKSITEDDLNWIVDCISDSVYKDSISEQCALYYALKSKYISAAKAMEQLVMYGNDMRQLSVDDFIVDEPCMIMDNREFRRHGYNHEKETSYKKPNRRRPWE